MGLFDFIKRLFGPPASGEEAPAPAASGGSGGSDGRRGPPPDEGPQAGYGRPDTLGLTAEELRARASKVSLQGAWSGRFDVIPPADDERTALVDRGLVLAGKVTQAELDDIHAVGDDYLKYHRRDMAARVRADLGAAAAVSDLRAERAQRKADKQAEARARREAHAQAVAERKATDIVFLGRGVSRGLADRRSDVERLRAAGLPVLSTPADVAQALEVSVPELRWLAFHSEATERPNYVSFEIPKRRGGTRSLSAPHAKLKAAQRKVLDTILAPLPPEPAAQGFVKGKSTCTNADVHVGRAVVVCLDLSDFFPTITFGRVRGLFQSVGYSPAAATCLALLCTESPRAPIAYDGTTYQVALGPPALPQGAPTSPAISNLVAGNLDRRLAGFAAKHGWAYTRYADDLTFSGGPDQAAKVPALVRMAEQVANGEGFRVHPDKTRVMRQGQRQTVTGLVVNDKRGLPRTELRRLRAILHNAQKTGLAAQNREGHAHFRAYLEGMIAYVHMVDPAKAAPLREALARVSD